jgi:putative hydrolase of the HAD superfamily
MLLSGAMIGGWRGAVKRRPAEARMPVIDVIGLDADDTLWHNETLYSHTQEQFRQLLAPYHSSAWIDERLYTTEMRNLATYGYGIKGFTLSMIETAIELTEGRIGGREIARIIELARAMMAAPVELLPGVAETLPALAARYRLLLITKGDLFDQESKVARSGLGAHFERVEIVSDKTEASYRQVLARHGIAPERFVMVGNSLRSDVVPVIAIGARAVYIPYHLTWAHEAVAPPVGERRYIELASIRELPAALAALEAGARA